MGQNAKWGSGVLLNTFFFIFPSFSFCFRFFTKCFHSRIPWGKSEHSELALFALYSLVVTFPCGMVHILVMIRLRVIHGGRWVGQVLLSYQNRQICALDETADAPVWSSSLWNTCLSSPDSAPSRSPRRLLTGVLSFVCLYFLTFV